MDGVRGYTSKNYETSPVKVLVVDDTRSYAKLVGKLLEVAGVGVKVFYDPRDALSSAQSNPDFNVAVLDLQMPGMNGNELEYALRNIPGKRDLKVIMPTADDWAVTHYDEQRTCRRGVSRTVLMRKPDFAANPKQHLDDVLAA